MTTNWPQWTKKVQKKDKFRQHLVWTLRHQAKGEILQRNKKHSVQTQRSRHQRLPVNTMGWLMVPHGASQNLGEKAPCHTHLGFWWHCAWRYYINHFSPNGQQVVEGETGKGGGGCLQKKWEDSNTVSSSWNKKPESESQREQVRHQIFIFLNPVPLMIH